MASFHHVLITLFVLMALVRADNGTFFNPILPGWNSDPSCVHVDGTFYCVTSTFISFPGMPVYASTDLIHWRMISHVWNRESQMPGASQATKSQQGGFFAATIRHHDDKFWVACEYLGLEGGMLGTIFTSTDPFDESTWSDPFTFLTQAGDLDLFWDDGTLYIPGGGTGAFLQKVDLEAGKVISNTPLWPGTGGVWPEGPHLYRKDGWYYLTLAEGGTELGHYQVMARSKNLTGPYEEHPNNPILTNRGTDEYFHTVGHMDLFQDQGGNWWGTALATRSGPEWHIYPMGRETVLFPVSWPENEWPTVEQVRGKMNCSNLPAVNTNPPGEGPIVSAPDAYDFPPSSAIPRNLIHWRIPFDGAFSIGPQGGLKIKPSAANLTGDGGDMDGRSGLSFIARRQTDTLFDFEVDIQHIPQHIGEESGVTIFLTQNNHVDLGMVLLPSENDGAEPERVIRFRAIGEEAPSDMILPVPTSWDQGTIRFRVSTVNSTHYILGASSIQAIDNEITSDFVSARVVSGQSGPFTGTLIGVYTSYNGFAYGDSESEAIVTRWRYTGKGQFRTSQG
ncbi:unnamed protein product [Clonostachys solani]|uniref:Beta-xylosidase C-terminal Concanavalin A-like domain-containing protein n=1 Tax=Clonostachys solani TaxID=160281 RepID=A0A9P0EJT4_9HYPO|nr:unnamed protein product [Clonostachys solani]